MSRSPWWVCEGCGFYNKPRVVPNSLGTLPAGHDLFKREWREVHCEQCGSERSADAPEYSP